MRNRGFEVVSAYKKDDIALPQRKTQGSAGYDLASATTTIIAPGEVVLVPTGLKAYMAAGEYLGLHIRSGLATKQKLCLVNGQGIVDADYYNNPDNEGHILLALLNMGSTEAVLQKGERVAQGIFYNYLLCDDDQAAAQTRQGGFGSTGEK